MQVPVGIADIGFSPSFSCYSTDSLSSMAADKVSREVKEEHAADEFQFSDGDEGDFEFSFDFSGAECSPKERSLSGRKFFPLFNSDLMTNDEVAVHDDPSVMISLEKLFIGEKEDVLCSSSSSEVEEQELEDLDRQSRGFCVSWRNAGGVGWPTGGYKKSRSTGSGSRRWRIRDILRRSNSAGKEMMLFLCPKNKVDASKQKQMVKVNVSSGEARKLAGKSKRVSSRSVHELFYVQKKEERKGDKMKSYLRYRTELFGFFVLPF